MKTKIVKKKKKNKYKLNKNLVFESSEKIIRFYRSITSHVIRRVYVSGGCHVVTRVCLRESSGRFSFVI